MDLQWLPLIPFSWLTLEVDLSTVFSRTLHSADIGGGASVASPIYFTKLTTAVDIQWLPHYPTLSWHWWWISRASSIPVPFTQLVSVVDLQQLPFVPIMQLVLLYWLHLVQSQLVFAVEPQWIPFTQLMVMAFSAPFFGVLSSGSVGCGPSTTSSQMIIRWSTISQ